MHRHLDICLSKKDIWLTWLPGFLPVGGPGMDDQGQYGGAFPGCGVRPAHQLTSQPSVHRPTRQNQVWLSHHHGGREEVKTRDPFLYQYMWKPIWMMSKTWKGFTYVNADFVYIMLLMFMHIKNIQIYVLVILVLENLCDVVIFLSGWLCHYQYSCDFLRKTFMSIQCKTMK